FRFPGALAEPSCHASVSFTDRNYLAGAKLAFARPAGHGWDVAAAVEARTGRDMHVEGVFTNALTAGFRAARHFGEGHTLAFLLIVPPSVRGTRLSSVEEAFRLTGDNLYNPAWGFQDGKVRNSRVRRELVPLAAATYCVRLSPATWLDMAAGAEYGVRKYSALGWYDARTPMPDNYRYLPGYTGDRETELAWRSNDARYTQVCWDELIARNRMAGGHAVYTLEDRAERIRNLGFDALFTTAPDERLTLRYGFSYRHARTRSYKQMRDLLGADHITDIDQYLVDDDTYGNLLQNDLRHPGRTVREGDRFGYDYALSTREATVRLSAEYRSDRLRADVALALGDAVVLRRGYYEKELFPGRSPSGARGGWGSRPIRSRHWWGGLSRPAATSKHRPQPGLRCPMPPTCSTSRCITTVRSTTPLPGVSTPPSSISPVPANGFRSALRPSPSPRSTASSPAVITTTWRVFTATWPLRASDAWPAALEAAADLRLAYRWSLRSPLRAGGTNISATRASRSSPTSTIRPSTPCRKPHGRLYARCRTPAYGLRRTLIFRPRGWGFRASAGYAGLRYVEPVPLRRTARIARQGGITREMFDAFTHQERLGDAFTFDASLFKSFYFGRSRLTASLMLRNLLGDADTVYSGYESLRVRRIRSGDALYFAPHATLYLCLSAFVLSYDLL
ncbi:MAG: TonB-dependent receptor, partial [Alistipes onderdonkii]